MAYNFNKSDGVTPVSVADGAINTSDFSIGLVGKNVSGYGLTIARNLVHMVEHFAAPAGPANPTTGQLWYNTTTGNMNVWNGAAWEELISGAGGGDILPTSNCNGTGPNIGSPSLRYCNMYAVTFHGDLNGTANAARYSDLAERFEADKEYEVGTVVKLGGDKEVTATTDISDLDVLGVISHTPGYLMNSAAGDNSTHPPVAFAGRVPVKITGSVKKGDRLVSSAEEGTAQAYTGSLAGLSPYAVIGRALEDSDGDTVMAVVGAK